MQCQGHKVALAICLLSIIEKQAAGAPSQEYHLQRHLLPGATGRQAGDLMPSLHSWMGVGRCFPSPTPLPTDPRSRSKVCRPFSSR